MQATHPEGTQISSLSIVIPAYNEAERLPTLLADLKSFLSTSSWDYEVLVVDDGSSDETSAHLERAINSWPKLRSISYHPNRGKGYAVKQGVLASKKEIILFMDADGSTPPAEANKLLSKINQGFQVAIGSRAIPGATTTLQARAHRKFLGRLFNSVVNFLVLPGIYDTQCGFKAFRSSAAKWLFSIQRMERYSFDIEVLYLARRAGFSVSEVAVDWHHKDGSKVSLLTDAPRMLLDAFRLRLLHRKVNFTAGEGS